MTESLKQYEYRRFDWYMEQVDLQILSRELAIAAFKEEIEYSLDYQEADDDTK